MAWSSWMKNETRLAFVESGQHDLVPILGESQVVVSNFRSPLLSLDLFRCKDDCVAWLWILSTPRTQREHCLCASRVRARDSLAMEHDSKRLHSSHP